MTNTENAGEEIVLDQKEEVLNLRQEEDNSEENNEKQKTKDASSKGENQAEEIEEEVEEEEEEKDQNNVQEIHEVRLQEQQDDNEEKEEKDDNEEKDDHNQEKSEENENEDNNQKPQEEVNLRIVQDNDDVKKSDLYLDLQPNLKVKVEWFKKDDDMNIEFSTASKSKVLLHWGVFKNNNTSQWCQPNNQFYPKLTSEPDAFSLNTEFSCLQDDDEQKIFIRLPTDSFDEFNFVFYNQDEDRWHNNFGQDYHIKNE